MEVLELLESRGIHWVYKGGDEYGIECPNAASHSGSKDSSPSFNINVEKLQGHCFACGFSMNEERLVKWLTGGELDDFSLQTMALRAKLKRLSTTETTSIQESNRAILIPPGEPWDEDGYRGISIDTYRKLGAIRCDRGWYVNRICFPVYLGGELVGVDARALGADMQPKYLRPKGCNCREEWLYPFDLVKASNPKYVVLVEGIYDSIAVFDKLGPVGLSIFGTENFSMSKLRLILKTGCEEVVMFFDKDEAGQAAQKKIGAMISDWLRVSEAFIDHLPIDPRASISKGKLVYKDCGDLSKSELEYAIEHRTSFRL